MNKIEPIKKINLDTLPVGGEVQIHAGRLASFKATVSRYNKGRDSLARFSYGAFKNDYCTVTRVADVTRTT